MIDQIKQRFSRNTLSLPWDPRHSYPLVICGCGFCGNKNQICCPSENKVWYAPLFFNRLSDSQSHIADLFWGQYITLNVCCSVSINVIILDTRGRSCWFFKLFFRFIVKLTAKFNHFLSCAL